MASQPWPVGVLRDVLHNSQYNQCGSADDVCSTWAPAIDLNTLLAGPRNPDGYEIWHQRWYNPGYGTAPHRHEATVRGPWGCLIVFACIASVIFTLVMLGLWIA